MAEEKNVAGSNSQPQGGAPRAPEPTPPQPPTEAAVPQEENPLQSDISKILKEVKLPERRNQSEIAPRRFDTSFGKHAPDEAPHLSHDDIQPLTPVRDLSRPSVADLALNVHRRDSDVRPLHTLKDDLQNVVKDKKISIVRAAALEEEKRHRVQPSEIAKAVAARPRRFGLALFASLTMVVLGVLALIAVFLVMQERQATSNDSLGNTSLVFAEQTIPLPLDDQHPNDVRRALGALRDQTVLTLGAILHVVPTIIGANAVTNETAPRMITFQEFMTALGANPPAELMRALDSTFFFGMHTVDENAPVLVIPVTSYERAFSGMLQWEKTINADLAPVFSAVPRQTIGEDGLPKERTFEDAVMRNFDVRQLKDDTGTVQLYYSFPSRNILIIAESPFSFTELLSRLRADRRL